MVYKLQSEFGKKGGLNLLRPGDSEKGRDSEKQKQGQNRGQIQSDSHKFSRSTVPSAAYVPHQVLSIKIVPITFSVRHCPA